MRAESPRPSDVRFMRRALALAARGLGRTYPNPPVGAVLVRGGRVVGEGFHAKAGGPHAEIEAIRAAGARACGADLFVTLEPCTHQGRTPPCLDAVLALQPARVVVAAVDPDPRVRGRGIRGLRRHGVPVVVGVEAAAAGELLEAFRSRVVRGRPRVTLKLALTLDGRIAARDGDARWITGAAARRMGHELRGVSDAVLVGAGTVRADDPRLTCRIPGGHDPVRVVVSGRRLDLPRRARVLAPGGSPTIVVAPATASSRRVTALRSAGVEVLLVPARAGRMSFAHVMAALGERGFTSVLVEGGGTVAAEALRAGVVDRAVLFVAPTLLGGDGVAAVGPLGIRRVADAIRLTHASVRRIGDDLVVQGRPRWRRHPLPPAGSRGTVGK